MFNALKDNSAAMGSAAAVAAVFCFSINDVAIKFLSGDYALHQVVMFRSIFGIMVLCAIVIPFSGGFATLRTRRPVMHLLRGLCVVLANTFFFLGLAALPLAEGVAIFFISPLVITVFSVIFLGETVGPRRWAAIAIGLLGVIVVLRPGTAAFQIASLLPLTAALFYGALHMMTRRIGGTESAAAMSFYIQVTFVFVSAVIGLSFGDGRFAAQDDLSLAFLFRGWVWPATGDFAILAAIGAASAFGGFFISQAYRVSEAALVAPFEYIALPLAVIWGLFLFDEKPDAIALAGIALILGSGLYMIWREARTHPKIVEPKLRS